MRADFLTRFAEQYTSGLARLSEEGAVFTNARWSYGITDTAPGHASLATGSFPSRHGIVGNSWWDRKAARQEYSVEDLGSAILGHPNDPGRSPVNLRRGTLGDWLKLASPASKVFSVGLKDRAAILMGGRHPDGAFWYQSTYGQFVTSAYYMAAYPDWVDAFNREGRADAYRDREWTKLLPDEAYGLSRRDRFPSEADGVRTIFPHRPDELVTPENPYYKALAATPFADEMTFDFARELVVRHELGLDDAPDLLWIGAAAADYIGHTYGPYSREVQDHFLRLDRMLGGFFAFLDERVGPERYFVALTSDHGVLPMPEELVRRGVAASRIDWAEPRRAIQPGVRRVRAELGDIAIVPMRIGLALNTLGAPTEEQMRELRSNLANDLLETDFVEDVFTYEELLAGSSERPFFDAYLKSFHRERTPDITVRYKENILRSAGPFSTDHGSPYPYDADVPLVFLGRAAVAGRYDSPVDPVALAPTLALLLGLDTPDDLDAGPLAAAIR